MQRRCVLKRCHAGWGREGGGRGSIDNTSCRGKVSKESCLYKNKIAALPSFKCSNIKLSRHRADKFETIRTLILSDVRLYY